MLDLLQKNIAGLLIVAVLAPAIYLLAPQKAEAQAGLIGCFAGALGLGSVFGGGVGAVQGLLAVPVNPVTEYSSFSNSGQTAAASQSLTFKECVLDALVWVAKEIIIAQITASILEWIQSGFDGAPTFISDFGGFMRGLADNAAGLLLTGSDFAFLCSPFQGSLQFNIALNFTTRFRDTIECRLSDIVDNIQGFIDGFEITFDVNGNSTVQRDTFTRYGGWDEWGDLWLNPANNGIGAYLMAEQELHDRIFRQQAIDTLTINVGNGYASIGSCLLQDVDGGCVRSEIEMPGKFVESYIAKHIGASGIERLGLADEIDEILGALLQQLITMLIQQGVGLLNAAGDRDSGNPSDFSSSLRDATAQQAQQAALQNQQNNPGQVVPTTDPNLPPQTGGTTGGGATAVPPPPPPPPPPPTSTTGPTVTFTATPASIAAGETATLNWGSGTTTTTCTGTNFLTNGATAGTVDVTPAVTTTYTVSCTDSTGQTDQTVTVTVGTGGTTGGGTAPPPPPPPPALP